MKRITIDELEVFLRKHKLWLANEPGGERATLYEADLRGATLYEADLRGADLRGADLRGANLYGADLRGANLRGANLYGANLYGANLYRADLSEADLSEADLRGANLYGANLYGADLYGATLYGADLRGANLYRADLSEADLSEADLRGANLYGADLRGANLRGANLYGANLYGANLSETNLNYPIACPEEGSFIGFKKCRDNLIVKLEVTSDALRCSATGRKCRCSKAKVLSITNLDGTPAGIKSAVSKYDPTFIYTVGENVEVKNFNLNRWDECSTGIYFFITRREAAEC